MKILRDLKDYLNEYHPVYRKNYVEFIVHCVVIPCVIVLIASFIV